MVLTWQDTDCNLAMVGFNLLEDDGLARMNGCRYAFSEGGLVSQLVLVAGRIG